MDVIYPYLAAPGDFELRYSLRSLSNLPHKRVILAGDRPGITSDKVMHVGVQRIPDRYRSSTTNIMRALEAAGTTGDFVVMHDDIFALEPWAYRHEHRGAVSEYMTSGGAMGPYRRALRSTYEILRAHDVDEPLFFGMHTPAVYDAGRFADLVREFRGQRYLTRTLYHNLFPQPGVRREDVKLKQWNGDAPPVGILSISDEVGRNPRFRSWIEARFPVPSAYELE